MGGFGSGRPSGGGKPVADACRSIDVNRLRKEGVLSAGWSGCWEWKRDGEVVSSISMRGEHQRIVLSYRYRATGEDWHDVEEPVPIRWVPCRYGGRRPYFVCPGVVSGVACGRRAVKLYSAGRYFLCRRCYRLTYTSCNEDACDRALRRANKIRIRLGGEPGFEAVIPRRPKGMWRKTYDRLFESVIANEAHADERLTLLAARLHDLEQSHANNKRNSRKGYWL